MPRARSTDLSASAGPRRVGRPPRIDRDAIGEAAVEIGLTDLTLRAVAEHLGVSVAGLYHHIEGKRDLLRLAAEHAARRIVIPEDRGQHWALWLREWAFYNRDAFVAQPELLGQFLEGAISAGAIAENTDVALGLLVRQGFTVREASEAYGVVSACALGSAIGAIRERVAADSGRPALAEYHRALAQRAADELPHFRALVAEQTVRPTPSFEDEIATVLAGIAVRRGERWEPVAEELARAAADHQH